MPLGSIVIGPGFGLFTIASPANAGPAAASVPPAIPVLAASAMSFGEFLTASQVWPFSLALALFFTLSLLEIVLTFTGLGGGFGLDLDLDVPDPDFSWRFLDWLGVGKVPFLVSLATFLFSFGMIGLAVQDVQLELVGAALPWPIVAVGCTLVSLPIVRVVNRLLGRVWPRDESSAVTADSLVGHEAVVVLGSVAADTPGQIKVRDQNGATHYALAHADVPGETFEPGVPLLIVGRRGATYTVIRHPNPHPTASASTST